MKAVARLSLAFARRLRLRRRGRLRLKQSSFLKIFFPGGDTGARPASEMAEKSVTPGFVLPIIFDCAPKQTTAATPTIEHNAIDEWLIFCSHDEPVILVRLFCPRRAPVQHN